MAVARIARLKIWEGKTKDFEAKFNEITEAARQKEPGTIYHILHRSRTDPSTYVIYEQYEDEAAMLAHGRTRHFNMLGIQLALFVDPPAQIEVIDPV